MVLLAFASDALPKVGCSPSGGGLFASLEITPDRRPALMERPLLKTRECELSGDQAA